MFSKRFAFLVILRIALLMLTLVALAFIFARTDLFFNQIILLGVVVIQVAELIRFVTFTNRELSRLLLAIRYSDFSISFKGKKHGKSFKELQDAFVEIVEAFKKVSVEKEAQYKFLQVIVENIKVGMIAIKEDYEVELMNKQAEELLGIDKPNYLKQLDALRPDFIAEVNHMLDNDRSLIELDDKGKKLQISMQVNRLKILNLRYTLITFQNIKSEIETKEIEAWHKLIRILTHEIMNSVTPITSMSETILMLLEENKQPKRIDELDEETLEDIRFSLKTIQKRSDGLLHFVEDYRKLTKIKSLDPETVSAKDLISSIEKLLKSDLDKEGIQLSTKIEAGLNIRMDRKLIEQVLINLITNAKHAVEKADQPKIMINAYSDFRHKYISITDNGIGVELSKQEQIFIPFFSTKEKGSGIGLSLSKQIMKKHNGDLILSSQPGEGATFFLIF